MKLLARLAVLAAVLLLGALLAAAWAWRTLTRPVAAPSGAEATTMSAFEIPDGQDAGTILARLEERGLIENAALARAYLIYGLGDPPLKAGEYAFESPSNSLEILRKLALGKVVAHTFTLIEGLTLEETAQHIAKMGFGDEARFLTEMRSPARIADLDAEAIDLEGYLYPDTYSFARGTAEAEIVGTLVRTFRQRLTAAVGVLPAESSVRSLVTLASIVEKESGLDAERPIIAGVYSNRLRRGIALYADPTIIFALKRLGRWDGNLRKPDLRLDSPYNTYIHAGLPPGPICSPGAASLKAAAAPADVPFIYFVSRNDGSHVFAETLAEHNRNVQEWQRNYWKRRTQLTAQAPSGINPEDPPGNPNNGEDR